MLECGEVVARGDGVQVAESNTAAEKDGGVVEEGRAG